MSIRAGAVLSALVALALYANSVPNGFALDDGPLIQHNPRIEEPSLALFFTSDFWNPVGEAGLYRPLVTTLFAAEHALFDGAAPGFHAVNVLLHAAACALLVLLAWQLLRDRAIAIGAGLLFAAHPLNTETVAGITMGRADLMVAPLGLLALVLHRRARATPGREARPWRIGSLVAFAVALLSKENAVTWLALFPVLDFLCPPSGVSGRSASGARALREGVGPYLAFGAVALAYMGLRFLALGELAGGREPGFVNNPIAHLPAGWRIANALVVVVRGLGLFLLPLDLSHDYSYASLHIVRSAGDPVLWGALAVLVALALSVAFAWRRSPGYVAGLAFAAITYSVTSNLLVPITAMMAERHWYVPAIGLCLAASSALWRTLRALVPAGRERAAFAAVLALLLALGGARTVLRNEYWEGNATLRLRDVATQPMSATLQTNVGFSLLLQEEHRRALEHFEKAMEIVGEPERWAAPWRGRIWALIALGREEEARAAYRKVWTLVDDPNIGPALDGRMRLPFGDGRREGLRRP